MSLNLLRLGRNVPFTYTVAAIKHDRSSHESCAHTCKVRVLGSIAFYSPVYWDVVDKILLFWTENMVLAAKISDKPSLHLPG
jgi:hypothetical protein